MVDTIFKIRTRFIGLMLLFLTLTTLTLNSCSSEEFDSGEITNPKGNFPVNFTLSKGGLTKAKPVGQAGKTAALDYEKKISSLLAVVFEQGNFYKTFNVGLSTAPSYSFDMKKVGTFTIYLVANANSDLQDKLAQKVTDVASYEKLVVTQGSDVHDHFLMSSESFTVTTKPKQEVTYPTPIGLVRLSARFDVYNKVEDLVMSKLTVKNRSVKSHLVLQNQLPSGFVSDKSYTLTSAQSKNCIAGIYGYENSNVGSVSIILEGTYKGKSIKPFSIVLDGVSVKRNHLYSIIISSEDDNTSPGDPGKLSFNLVVQDWNEATEIIWDAKKLKDLSVPDFLVAPHVNHTSTPAALNPTKVSVMTALAHTLSVKVTSKSVASKLEVLGTAPSFLTVIEGSITYKDNKMVQVYTLAFNANATDILRSVDFVVYNRFDKTKKRNFTVTQLGQKKAIEYTLSVTPKSLSFKNTGGSKTFSISAKKTTKTFVNGVETGSTTVDVPWSSSVTGTGFKVNKGTVTAAKNTTTSQRTGKVTVRISNVASGATGTTQATVNLSQGGGTTTTQVSYALTVSPTSLSFASTGGSKTFSVSAKKTTKTLVNGVETGSTMVDVPWSSSVTGTGFTINRNTITVTQNITKQIRRGTATVRINEHTATTKTVALTQAAATAVITYQYINHQISLDPSGKQYFSAKGENDRRIWVNRTRVRQTYIDGIYQPGKDVTEQDGPFNTRIEGDDCFTDRIGLYHNAAFIDCTENTTTNGRYGRLVVEYGDKIVHLDLEQAEADIRYETSYEISASVSDLAFFDKIRTKSFSVTTKKTVKKYVNDVYQAGEDQVTTNLPITASVDSNQFSLIVSGQSVTVSAPFWYSSDPGMPDLIESVAYVKIEEHPSTVATVRLEAHGY